MNWPLAGLVSTDEHLAWATRGPRGFVRACSFLNVRRARPKGNFGLRFVISSPNSFVFLPAAKSIPFAIEIYLIEDWGYSWHVCPGGASAGAVAQRSPPQT
jgi:hypothetical protein